MNDFYRGALMALAWIRLNLDLSDDLKKHKEDVNECINKILDDQGSDFYIRVLGGKKQQ